MVKDKPDQTRIYDEEGYRQRAACLCVKNESESEVSLTIDNALVFTHFNLETFGTPCTCSCFQNY